jgi:aminopeptidase N
MLVRKIGEDHFRKGIQEYLKTYAYGNATWEGLIDILDSYTEEDLKTWSHIWINEKGMPTIQSVAAHDSAVFIQTDPWERNLVWPQDIRYTSL